jgi:hypothetical protein
MYHVELRHFPHSAWRFNLSDQELRTVVEPWIREQAVDFGERKWSPHLARLTILEGPKLEVQQISMGRGWRTAQRQSEDVTEPVLSAARHALQQVAGGGGVVAAAVPGPAVSQATDTADEARGGGPHAPGAAAPTGAAGTGAMSDPVALGVQLAALLGPDPTGLLEAWREAAGTSPGLPPSDSLALAERALRRAGADQG